MLLSLHVKYNAHALFLMGSRLFQLDYDRTGKILISQMRDSLFSLMFTIPRKYSIKVRSESSAAALLKNPRPSVLA